MRSCLDVIYILFSLTSLWRHKSNTISLQYLPYIIIKYARVCVYLVRRVFSAGVYSVCILLCLVSARALPYQLCCSLSTTCAPELVPHYPRYITVLNYVTDDVIMINVVVIVIDKFIAKYVVIILSLSYRHQGYSISVLRI